MILDGSFVAKQIRKNVKIEVDQLRKRNLFPKLAVIQVGRDEASVIYLRNKKRACKEVGILFEEYYFEETVTTKQLKKEISKLNKDISIHGILIQYPLPKHLDEIELFNMISLKKDVDGFTFYHIGKLCHNQNDFVSCTALGIVRLLKEYHISLAGKHVVVVGRSVVVGKPLAMLCLQENATVTILHSQSKNVKEIMQSADILISAVGKPKVITEDMVKEGSTVVDVGIHYVNGKVMGDVDFEKVQNKAKYITPVPGGVGPMTVAMLLENVVKACKKKI